MHGKVGKRRWRSESFEPKEINFCELTREYHPGRQWQNLSLDEQVGLIRRGLKPDSFLLNPNSDYMKYWDLVIAIALIFTGVVTPYEVIFMKTVAYTDVLFIINRMVDIIFVKDMIMQFFLKTESRKSKMGKTGTHIIKNPWVIRKQYLSGWFSIDFVSVLPFDIWMMSFETSDGVKGIKILRCLRLLRLVKLVRILRTSRLVLRWQNFLAISFSNQKLAKFSFILMLCSHWMACCWGLVGLSYGRELCDEEGNMIPIDGELPVDEVSWITNLFLGGKTSPDDPCNPMHVYTASLHWSVMTITSIGYGDIYPVRYEEYWAGILFMLIGGICWAYIIGSACGILANLDPVEAMFEMSTDRLNTMMRETGVPQSKRLYYREFLREAKAFDTLEQFKEVAKRFSPHLKGELLLFFSSAWTNSVSYFRAAPERLVMDVAEMLEPKFFSRKETLHSSKDCLGVVERGTLACAGVILMPGSTFNRDFIVSNPYLRKHRPTVSLTYSLVHLLAREDFFSIVKEFPEYASEVKKAATKIALIRAMVLCARKHKTEFAGTAHRKSVTWPGLSDIFDAMAHEQQSLQDIQDDNLWDSSGDPVDKVPSHEANSMAKRLLPRGVFKQGGLSPAAAGGVMATKSVRASPTTSSKRSGASPSTTSTLEDSIQAAATSMQAQLSAIQQQLDELRLQRLAESMGASPSRRPTEDMLCI